SSITHAKTNVGEDDQCRSRYTQREKPRFIDTTQHAVTIDGEDLEDVKTFTYSVSIIDEHGGSDADVNARIGKARAAYLQLRNIWNSKQLSVNQYQGQDFHHKCQDSSTIWGGNLENYESHHSEVTSVC
ncbi:unnamed protein product, partial [Schistosoma margrebowiei]